MRAPWAHKLLRMLSAFVISIRKEIRTRKVGMNWTCTTGIFLCLKTILLSPPSFEASLRRPMKSCEGYTHRRKNAAPQPIAKSAGCIFKNPQNCSAGQLVEELGLKNSGIGKARVSEVHGNFIVNDGGATAAEMLELIEKIKTVARAQRGIELETEVQIVGEPA